MATTGNEHLLLHHGINAPRRDIITLILHVGESIGASERAGKRGSVDRGSNEMRLLLDSRVVDVSMASNSTLVFLSSLEPFSVNSPENAFRFSDNTGA